MWTPNAQLVIGDDRRTWSMLEDTWGGIGGRWSTVVAPDPDLVYTDSALETIRVSRGRTEVFSEPRAGFITAELADLTGDGFDIRPFHDISLTIDDDAGQPLIVFRGRVSDTSATLYDSGFESGFAKSIHTVIGVGPLADLNTEVVGAAGLPQQNDGDRITALVAEAGFDTSAIDPGVFDLAPLPPTDSGYNALVQSYRAAFSAQGVVWDDREGNIAYANIDRRRDIDVSDSYVDLPAAILSAGALTVRSSGSDIANDITVPFASGVIRRSSGGSIALFGRVSRQLETDFADASGAATFATNYLAGHASPFPKLEQITARLDLVTDATLRDTLIALEVNDGIRLNDIPATLGLGFRDTFLEGIDWFVDRERVAIALNVSDAILSLGFIRWEQVDPTLTWDDVDANLVWANAQDVTA